MRINIHIKKMLPAVLLLVMISSALKAQTPGTNYVRTRVPQEAVTDTSKMDTIPVQRQAVSIQYSDALGRSLQTIQVQGSASQKDMVIPYVYDNMGRQSISYLPYADEGTGSATAGTLRSNAVNNVLSFYSPASPGAPKIATDASPYAQSIYEASPLGRIMEQGAPGTVYQPGTGHTVTAGYHVNSLADGINYYYNIPGSTLVPFTPFQAGTLSKTIVTDENGHVTEVWKDLQDRIVTRTRLGTATGGGSGSSGGSTRKVADLLINPVQPPGGGGGDGGGGGGGGGGGTTPVHPPINPVGPGPVLHGTNAAVLSTDYVYNDLGQLSNIVTAITKNQITNYGGVGTQYFIQQSYNFNYDSLGRPVEKKVPDKGWVYVVYNHANRPVLSQDSNLRAKGQWMYMKYDAEGRIVQTGIYTNTTIITRTAMQQLCDSNPVLWEAWQAGTGYTDNAFPQSNVPAASPLQVYTLFYYDDYSFSEAAAKPFQANVYNTVPTMRTMGMLTGSSVYVLGTANQRLVTVNYYDSQDRLIQQLSDNHLGQVDVVSNQYDFISQLTGSQRTTTAIAGQPITVKDRYVYDHLDRLLDTYESFKGSAEVDISHTRYNEMGQLVSEGLHGKGSNSNTTTGMNITENTALTQSQTDIASSSVTLNQGFSFTASSSSAYIAEIGGSFAQTQEFRYNIRGWITGINNGTLTYDNGVTQSDPNALFGETISYDQPALSGSTAQYNGNISGVTWRNKIEKTNLPNVSAGGQGYGLNYDQYDRLTAGNYYTQDSGGATTFSQSATGAYNETIAGYDVMGNIDSLQRSDGAGNAINDLVYKYQNSSNQLDSVGDAGTQNRSGAFTYDGNGNMISDSYKGIVITYNYMDLPDTVKKGSSRLVFTYDAEGNKLYKQLIVNGAVTSQRHYVDDAEVTAGSSIAYDGKVESVATAGGRILLNGSSYQYEYELQDHLGNNRLSFQPNANGQLTVSMVQNYYPFGQNMGDATMNYSASPQNNYLYNGQELQPELDLDTYDFGARHYDPVLGRWTAIDPLADEYEDFSPYNYVENNPMNMIDPDGMGVDPSKTCYEWSSSPSISAIGWLGAGANAIVSGVHDYNAFGIHASQAIDWKSSLAGVQENQLQARTGGKNPPGGKGDGYQDPPPPVYHDGDGFSKGLEVLGYNLLKMVLSPLNHWHDNTSSDPRQRAEDIQYGKKAWVFVGTTYLTGRAFSIFGEYVLNPAGEYVVGRMAGDALTTGKVFVNPEILEGKSLENVKSQLSNSKGWQNDVMRKSATNPKGGWVLRELNKSGTDYTDRMIQYHPGTPRHFGGKPYWKVSSGAGTIRIPAVY